MDAPNLHFLFRNPAHLIALGFGAGLAPGAPGTVGTLLGFPLFLLLAPLPPTIMLVALVGLFALGVWACGETGKALGVSDHGSIVWDEVVAFALVLAFTPQTLAWFAAAFVLFRLFDIWKPWPIRYIDRTVKGGFGVMLDDLLAAGYAILVMQIAVRVIQWSGSPA